MFKHHKTTLLLSSLLIILPTAAGLLLWHKLPDTIATHWNASGVADGYSSKGFAVLGIPLFLLAFHWLCIVLTSLDKKVKEQNRKAITLVLWIIPCISLVVETLILITALGCQSDITVWFSLLIGVMFLVIGNYMPKCTQNRYIGIKLPWTLASEENWYATHRLAGRLWVFGGFLFFLLPFLPVKFRFIPVLPIILLMVLIPTVYSYLFYKKHK